MLWEFDGLHVWGTEGGESDTAFHGTEIAVQILPHLF